MQLSDGEKLILFMLAEIYKRLEIKGDVDPDFVQTAISSGHYWGLKTEYAALLSQAQATENDVDETLRIMNMWRVIEYSFAELSSDEKKRVVTEAGAWGDVTFPGFDGNTDAHYGVARFVVDHLGSFGDFKDRSLNSHSSLIEQYRRMLAVFKPMAPAGFHGLSADDIIALMKARSAEGSR